MPPLGRAVSESVKAWGLEMELGLVAVAGLALESVAEEFPP